MDAIDRLEDEVMAMDFAFKTLARALHRKGVLPMNELAEQIGAVADQVRQSTAQGSAGDLHGVSDRLVELRASLLQLQ